MKWLAKLSGAIVMTGATLGLVVLVAAPVMLDPSPAWIPGYLLLAFTGTLVGIGIALGGYWLGTGRFLPDRDRWTLPAAAVIVGAITGDISFLIYAMLVNRNGESPTWAIAVFVAVIVVLVAAAVVHQVLYATKARRELARWAATPTAGLIPDQDAKVVGTIQPMGPLLETPIHRQPCVWWSLDAVENTDSGGHVVLQTSEWAPFAVADGSGHVAVSLGQGRIRATLSKEDQEVAPVVGGSLAAQVLAAHHVPWSPGITARVLFLRPGRDVALLGRCAIHQGAVVLGPRRDGELMAAAPSR